MYTLTTSGNNGIVQVSEGWDPGLNSKQTNDLFARKENCVTDRVTICILI